MPSEEANLERAVRELKALGHVKRLIGPELHKAKELMGNLKGIGYSNREICEMTDNSWSEATVKLYTKGVRVKNPAIKENASKIISDMLRMDLSLGEVKAAVDMKADMQSKDLAYEDISYLLEEANTSKIEAKDLVQKYISLIKSKVPLNQLTDLLQFKISLDKMGFTVDSLKSISDVASNIGDPAEIIEALSSYKNKEELQRVVTTLGSKKGSIEKEFNVMTSELKDIEKKKSALQQELVSYEQLKSIGFNEQILSDILQTSKKYGGLSAFLEGFDKYSSKLEIEQEIKTLENKRQDEASEFKKLEADNAYQKNVIDMCDIILKKGFGTQAIDRIFDAAKKYGEPVEVLKAIDKYEDTNQIQKKSELLLSQKEELEGKIKELDKQRSHLSGQVDAIGNSILQKVNESVEGGLIKMELTMNKYGEIMAAAKALEEPLMLARVIMSIINYPEEARQLDIGYSVRLLEGAAKLCNAKGINPPLKLEPALMDGFKFAFPSGFGTVDVIDVALASMRYYISGGTKR